MGIRKIERMIRPSSNVGIGQSTHLSFKRHLLDLNHGFGNNVPTMLDADVAFITKDLPPKDRVGVGSYNNNNHRRFGTIGSMSYNNPQNGNTATRNTSHVPDNTREARFHIAEPQYGADGSSGGCSTSTITSPVFGRNISWD